MKVPVSKTRTKAANANSAKCAIDIEERIRRRAYELYERRGREDGHETEDWLRAEAELTAERNQPVAVAAVKAVRKAPAESAAKAKAKPVKKSRYVPQINSEAD